MEAIRAHYGLGKSVINCFQQINLLELGNCLVNPMETQFFIYADNLLRGELGVSYHSNRWVLDVPLDRPWNTMLLVVADQIFAIVIGIALGNVRGELSSLTCACPVMLRRPRHPQWASPVSRLR